MTLSTDLIVGSAPPQRAGAASGISETGTELGGALGIAILGSIGTAVYRSQIADAVPPDAPAQAATAARDTLGGAVASADQLPPTVLQAATEAFTHGFQLARARAPPSSPRWPSSPCYASRRGAAVRSRRPSLP